MIKATLASALRWTLRIVAWTSLGLMASILVAALVFQFWFLPRANEYREDIAAAIGRATGVQIQIGALAGYWREWRPSVTLSEVQIKDPAGRDGLAIVEIRSDMAWKSLLLGEIRLHSLEVSRLALEIRRDAAGRLFVAGIPLTLDESRDGNLGDWLLRQDTIQISDSTMRWIDDGRGSPPLELSNVQLSLGHRFGANHFELQAAPPMVLGAPFAIRGEIKDDRASPLFRRGVEMDVNFPYINLAEALRYWPVLTAMEQAAGSITAHVELDNGAVWKARAKVALANVAGRMGQDLDPLRLESLSGGLDYLREAGHLELKFRDLSFSAGAELQQTNLSGEFSRKVDESGVLEMNMRFDALDLAPVTRLSRRLPLPKTLRDRLEKMAPVGRLKQLQLSTREQAGHIVKFNIVSEFDEVSFNALDAFPGVGNLSGSVKGDEHSGSVVLRGRHGWLDLPKVMPARTKLEQLDARVQWTRREGATQVKLQEFTLSNEDFAGSIGGIYRHTPGTAGYADLSANLTRAQANAVWRYVPMIVPEGVRQWLQHALVAGQSNQVSLILRGDLSDFPFSHGRSGLFEVKARASDGVLDYVKGWPRIENIAADLLIRGARLDILNASGRISRVNLSGVTVAVPDLNPKDPRIAIQGSATGSSAEFLRFLADSPLDGLTGGLAREISAAGEGRLSMHMELPLLHPHETKVTATFSVTGNQLTLPVGLGTLDQLAAIVRITEKGVSAQGATANYLGGPVRADLMSQEDGTLRVRAAGRASGPGVARLVYPAWERYITGSASWQGDFRIAHDRTRFVIDSNLAGMGSKLPDPFGKSESEALTLRVERTPHESGLSLLRAQLGERVLLRFLSPEESLTDIKSGELVFGGASGESEQVGLRVSGRLPALDTDAWRAALPAQAASATARENSHFLALVVQGLKIDRLRSFYRDFGDVTVNGRRGPGSVQLNVEGKAVSGDLAWKDQGSGQLTLKLARLYLPPSTNNGASIAEIVPAEALPTVDAQVLDFRMGERDFGKLALNAIAEGRQWRLRQLEVKSPEGFAQFQGTYDLRAKVPRMNVDVNVEVSDVGSYFARLKLPPGIKRGKAKLTGTVQWSGAPYSLDLPSLSGRLQLDVKQGQFIKVEPGVGKLLGVLSLQALPRRLTLDFRDVFSEGFAFTQINATSDIGGGVATTQDFKMSGPGAVVELKGSADLVRETQNLKVRVLPGLSDSVSVAAGAIVNPAIGLATYLAQKVLKDPVDKLFSQEYEVTGTWADPTVSRMVKQSPTKPGRR